MAKHTTAAGPLTREAVAKRIRDEIAGIGKETVDFGGRKKEEAPVPDIRDLGLATAVRKKLETLAADQAELGKIEREAKKDREKLTTQIKELLAEHVPNDIPCFTAGPIRIALYTQNRPSFDKDVMKTALLRLGVQPSITNKAMTEATSYKAVTTLRISMGNEEDA